MQHQDQPVKRDELDPGEEQKHTENLQSLEPIIEIEIEVPLLETSAIDPLNNAIVEADQFSVENEPTCTTPPAGVTEVELPEGETKNQPMVANILGSLPDPQETAVTLPLTVNLVSSN
jgi:hypothetical protein